MPSRIYIIFFLFVSISTIGLAQFQLPRIDVEAKVSQVVLPGDNQDQYTLRALETTNLSLGAHWQINQHFALGWIYSNSFRGSGYNINNFKFNFGNGDSKAMTMFSGLDLRISTGRAKIWRQYVSLNYGKAEIVEDKGSFRYSQKTNAIGGSIGVARRMGSHIYWNVFELGAKAFTDKIFWSNMSAMFEIKMGLTYNLGKKK
jgi:hypothetical protein